MTAPVPPSLRRQIEMICERLLQRYVSSGPLQNSSISERGLTLKGGFLRLLSSVTGIEAVNFGPVSPAAPDGTPQMGLQIRRSDGSMVLLLRDAFPDPDGTFNQALTWYDRTGHNVFADDTDSGFGMARPYLSTPFYRSRNSDWIGTSSTSFETLFRAKLAHQQPRLYVRAWAANSVSGGTGELRVMVNNKQWESTVTTNYASITEYTFGPARVYDVDHMATVTVELQARMTGGSGLVLVEPSWLQGMQS